MVTIYYIDSTYTVLKTWFWSVEYRKGCVTQILRIMKMKVCEVKSLAADCKCLEKAEVMLKRRDRLKCVSRSFRYAFLFSSDKCMTNKLNLSILPLIAQLELLLMQKAPAQCVRHYGELTLIIFEIPLWNQEAAHWSYGQFRSVRAL